MPIALLGVTCLLYLVWAVLLYRLHLGLERCDPQLALQAGRASWFWTPFNGHRVLVGVMRDPQACHAPLAGLIRLMRIWALLLVAVSGWLGWLIWQQA